MTAKKIIEDIILTGTVEEKKELFGFDSKTSKGLIAKKFKIFARGMYPRYFKCKSAPCHEEMVILMINSYFGQNFLNIAARSLAKTTLAKLFLAFVLLNDRDSYRKYIKVLTKDGKNSKQIVTDVYNLIVELKGVYGDVFEKQGDTKREETMSSFTMAKGVKLGAGTVGQTQRGHAQDAYRPDWIVGDDLEDKDSVRSQIQTQSIIDKWGEAVDGLSQDGDGGSYMVLGNYISDQGVIEHIRNKYSVFTLISPLADAQMNPLWPERDTKEKIEDIKKDADDFYGEYQCDPTRSKSKLFDWDRVNEDMQKASKPSRIAAGVNYWAEYQPHHRYGQGSDHSDGVGLDANALAGFDFTTGELIYTYANNEIAPDLAAHEFARVGGEFGNCLYAPEVNNKCGGVVLSTLKHIGYPNLFRQVKEERMQTIQTDKLGWETNKKTKHKMFFDFRKDYNDGLIKIHDIEVLKEMKAYSNADLQEVTTGLITRHFDLLTACFVKGTMVLTDKGQIPIEQIKVGDKVKTRKGYRKVAKTLSHLKKVITKIGLTGTPDHPIICNNNKIKDLSCIEGCDKLYVWDSKAQKIEKRLYTEVQHTIDTQTQSCGSTGFTLGGELSGKRPQNTYIERFGWIILEKFLQVLLFTTKTVMQGIIALKILFCYLLKNTWSCMGLMRKGKKNYDKPSRVIDQRSIKGLGNIIKRKNRMISSVRFVEKLSQLLLITQNTAQRSVKTLYQIIRGKSLSKKNNVQFAIKPLKQESHIKKDVQQNAMPYGEENTCQRVYNLEVEDVHEYFANNILVHNCVIAWQMCEFAKKAETQADRNKNYNEGINNLLNRVSI